VLLEGKRKRRTQAQIKEDKQRAQEAQAAQEATQQSKIDRIAGIEAAMEVEQATQVTGKVKPVRPRARPVKKKTDGKGADSDLTSESLPVPAAEAKGQGTGDHHISQDGGGVGAGKSKVVGSKAAARPPKKKASLIRDAISTATRQILDGKAPDCDKKGNPVPSVNLSSHHISKFTHCLTSFFETCRRPINLIYHLFTFI
jgi:hypothetical protein